MEHPALLELKLLADERDERFVEVPRNLGADGLEAAPALEHLLHVLTVVLLLLNSLAVRVDVGVARDAHDGRARGDVGTEATAEHGDDDVLNEGVADATLAGGKPDDAIGGLRDLDHAEHPMLIVAIERADDVQDAVLEVGEGVARVDDERRQDGSQVALEVAGDGDEIGVRVLLRRQALDALHLEGALELGEAALASLVQAREDREELGELL